MIDNLQTIARHYTGLPVVVVIKPTWPSLGFATYSPGGLPLIAVDGSLAPAIFARVFFHEIGHHALGHIAKPGENALLSLVKMRELCALYPDSLALSTIAEIAQLRVDDFEAAAWRWANEQLANFERQFGPFVDAIRGDNYGTVTD